MKDCLRCLHRSQILALTDCVKVCLLLNHVLEACATALWTCPADMRESDRLDEWICLVSVRYSAI